jgi:hypothetical protein
MLSRHGAWCTTGVLELAWEQVVTEYIKASLKRSKSAFKLVTIDTSYSKNVRMRKQFTGKNKMERGRQSIKTSAIVDSNRVTIGYKNFPGNNADVHTVLDTLGSIPVPIVRDTRFKITLLADRGYVSKDLAEMLELMGVRIVTEPKKNELRIISAKDIDIRLENQYRYLQEAILRGCGTQPRIHQPNFQGV